MNLFTLSFTTFNKTWLFSPYVAIVIICILCAHLSSQAQYVQVGGKLVGTGATNATNQGQSISLSGDGKTLAVGASSDSSGRGAVWVYTLSGSNWTQVGNKLIGSDRIYGNNGSKIGSSVSLSADGKTLAVGGSTDNNGIGAIWTYTFTGGNWSQIGNKLIGTGAVNGGPFGGAQQGWAVSLSGDGKTLAASGWADSGLKGAVWVYTFSGSNWSQVGSKLVGTGIIGSSNGVEQGLSLSLSGDGKTLAVGAGTYNTSASGPPNGAVWMFNFSGNGTWDQVAMVIGPTGTGGLFQVYDVSLSDNGKTLAVGGITFAWVYTFSVSGSNWIPIGDSISGTGNNNIKVSQVSLSSNGNILALTDISNVPTGGTWIFTNTGGHWSQYSSKLTGTGGNNGFSQGSDVSLSSDGKTVAESSKDNNSVWIFSNPNSLPTAINDDAHLVLAGIKIFPNPFGKEGLTIDNELDIPYELFDLHGNVLETGLSSSKNIGLSLPPGFYCLRTNNVTYKVVKIVN